MKKDPKNTAALESVAEVEVGSSKFYVRDSPEEAQTGLLIDFSEGSPVKPDSEESASTNLVSLLDTSLPSIPAAMDMQGQKRLPTPLVPPVEDQQQQFGPRYDLVPNEGGEEEFFVQTSNTSLSGSTNTVTSTGAMLQTTVSNPGNPFVTKSSVARQPVVMQRTNPFERTGVSRALPRYDAVAADLVTTTGSNSNSPLHQAQLSRSSSPLHQAQLSRYDAVASDSIATTSRSGSPQLPRYDAVASDSISTSSRTSSPLHQLPIYDDVPGETSSNQTSSASSASSAGKPTNQWVNFDEEKEDGSPSSSQYYAEVPKEPPPVSKKPDAIKMAMQAGKPAAACAPISVTKMTPIQPQQLSSSTPSSAQSVADSFDPLKKPSQPIYAAVQKKSPRSPAKSSQNNPSSSSRNMIVQTALMQSTPVTKTSLTGSVMDTAKALDSKLRLNPLARQLQHSKQLAELQKSAPHNHDDYTSSDRAPLISSQKKSSENGVKFPSKDLDFQHPKQVQATFVGSGTRKSTKDDDRMLLMTYPKKDNKSGVKKGDNLIQLSPMGEDTPGNSYVLDPTTPNLPPRVPLLQNPPVGRGAKRTLTREERRSDPLASRVSSHVFHPSVHDGSSRSCPIGVGNDAPPIPPRDPITDVRPPLHRQSSHPNRQDYDSKKSYILPIMRDGEKISNTHYFLLPPKPANMSDENEQFVNVPLSSLGKSSSSRGPATAHIKPIMRDGSDTHYLVTPPPLIGGSKDFFASSLRDANHTGSSKNSASHHPHHEHDFHKGSNSRAHMQSGSSLKDNAKHGGFDLSSLNPILPTDSTHNGSHTFSKTASLHKPQPHGRNSTTSSDGDDAELLQSETYTTAAEKVRRVQAQVHGVTMDECRGALIGNGWEVERAVHELKTEQLFQLGDVSREQCENLLRTMHWNLELAGSVLMDQSSANSED